MCIIFHRDPDGGRLDWELLHECFLRNPHGVGVVWSHVGRWTVEKTTEWSWTDTQDVLRDIERMSHKTWAVHFRYATVGKVDDDNCHPFDIGSGSWLMHNGTIDKLNVLHAGRSDSWHLANAVRRGRDLKWAAMKAKPSGSRLLVATSGEKVYRIGEWVRRSAGWFSNDRCFGRSRVRRLAGCFK